MKNESDKPKNLSRQKRFGELSKAERFTLIEKVFIRYPRLKTLHKKIDFCRTYSKIAAEPECLLIAGTQGAGKTTLLEWYAGDFPIQELPQKRVIPILITTVPAPATVKNLAAEMLKSIGDPAAERGTISSLTLRLRKFLLDCEVELIILDEFQHFDDRKSRGVLKIVSDWLKNLLNQTKIPIVLVGMPGCESVLDAEGNEQLKRRFSNREVIQPFRWKGSKENEEFRQLLKRIDDELPLLEDSNLADLATAFLIYEATDGVINYVMKLLRRASRIAVEDGRKRIDHSILAEVYKKVLAKEFADRPNPFLFTANACRMKEPAIRAPRPNKIGAVGKRIKAGKRKVNLSDVLSTR
jgi:predicted AAA+ superfamily ATPase